MSKSRLGFLSRCFAVSCDAEKAEIRAIAHRKTRDRGGHALKSQLSVLVKLNQIDIPYRVLLCHRRLHMLVGAGWLSAVRSPADKRRGVS